MRNIFQIAATALGLAMLPAQATVFAFAQSGDGARIELTDEPGPCVGKARLAEHVTPAGAKTPGCWLIVGDSVTISFLDGERGSIPLQHLKKVTGL